tara:strand:+ start:192 stop:461 length:270 start_codon:yes stop_codon:yes gene_type:complete
MRNYIAIQGLHEALIGIGVKGRTEVLVYDANKAQQILVDNGFGHDTLEPYLDSVGIDTLGDDTPIFVYLDDELADDINGTYRSRICTIH